MNNYARCGCDVVVDKEDGAGKERRKIRLLSVDARTKILATSSKTTLTQTFENPGSARPLEELRYVFPLYEGVSVVSFTAYIGSQIINGVVEEKSKATQAYREAKSRGEVAGLLEQSLRAGDVFITKIGNVPPGDTITVKIEYLADLKHDAEADAIRFTIPTSIAPRYGPAELLEADTTPVSKPKESFSVTIDAEMPDGSAIKSIQSPSHHIAVKIGSLSNTSAQEELSLTKASASLALEKAELAADFVIQIAATKLGEPSAMLETHPDIPNQRALMTTLVPKFNIPTEKPEIVFVCDRSGSMSGSGKIDKMKDALNVFLKSLPLGVKFNLVSFGNRHEFLWDCSQTYDQDTLDEAIVYVDSFSSNFGGTQMYQPLAETFEKRYKDMNLEVFLLTDGEIWKQAELFKLINDEVAKSSGAIRLFTVGIGRDASHALIEGAARAGNGFAQTVADNEQATTKFIRMLKASLTPHILDYSLDIKYRSASQDAEDDDFEFIEKVATTLSLETPEPEEAQEPKKTISLFDPSTHDNQSGDWGAPKALDDKYAHLPDIATPCYIQSPHRIPALFPFNRTTVYVLLSNANPDRTPESLLLKGTSAHGPLELEIPITHLPEKGSTIHQLAARNTIRELEEGRGWVFNASHPATGKPLQEEFEGRFSDMVEREAVQLGLKYQITGKWTSFVAVAAGEDDDEHLTGMGVVNGTTARRPPCRSQAPANASRGFACRVGKRKTSAVGGGGPQRTGGADTRSSSSRGLGTGGAMRRRKRVEKTSDHEGEEDSSDADMGFALFDDGPPAAAAAPAPARQPTSTPLQRLISLQRFDGSWTWSKDLAGVLGLEEAEVAKVTNDAGVHFQNADALATAAVILYLQKNLSGDKETWEMVVSKAEAWIGDKEGSDTYQSLRGALQGLF